MLTSFGSGHRGAAIFAPVRPCPVKQVGVASSTVAGRKNGVAGGCVGIDYVEERDRNQNEQ
jgi:hypothetical protein